MTLEKTNGQPKQQRDPVLQSPRVDVPPAKSGKRLWWLWLIIGVVIGVVVLAGIGFGVYRLVIALTAQKEVKEKPPIPVVYAKAVKGDLKVYLDGLGIVTALNTVSIHTRVDGQLDKVLYNEGDLVDQGQLLCELDSRPFEAQLVQAQGMLLRDEALLGDAKLNLKRYADLLKEPTTSITQATYDTQAALVKQYQGAAAIDQGQIDAANLNITYCKITAPFTGRIGLRLVDPGNIVHASDANPLAVVTQLQPITVIFTIAEDDIPKVMDQLKMGRTLHVDAVDRNLNLKKKLASGKLVAVDNMVDQTTGMIRLRAEFANGNIAVFHYHFLNKLMKQWLGGQSQWNISLFPNQFVNARLLVSTLHDVIKTDSAAIQRGPDFMFVYVVNEDKEAEAKAAQAAGVTVDAYLATKPSAVPGAKPEKSKRIFVVERRIVTVGQSEGNEVVVLTGLAAGEKVVTDGVDKLTDKAQVNPTKETVTTQPSGTGDGTPASQPATPGQKKGHKTTGKAGDE